MGYKHEIESNDYHYGTDTFVTGGLVKGDATIRIPKTIARIKLCGALTFNIDDTMNFETPTKEQRENLKKTFGIEVELAEEE